MSWTVCGDYRCILQEYILIVLIILMEFIAVKRTESNKRVHIKPEKCLDSKNKQLTQLVNYDTMQTVRYSI